MVCLAYLFIDPRAGAFLYPHRVSVDLVKTDNSFPVPGAIRADAMIISVQRDGSVFFNGDKIYPYKIPSRIRERLKAGSERRVYIAADARCKYGAVVEVIDSIREAGVEPLTFIVEKRRQSTSN
jgi:biopolymer transport protein ExbD